MPLVGVAKDRQVLPGLNAVLPKVQSMMCFGCAQIRAPVPLWQRMYVPGETGRHNVSEKTDNQWNENYIFSRQSLNDIEMYDIGHSLEKNTNATTRSSACISRGSNTRRDTAATMHLMGIRFGSLKSSKKMLANGSKMSGSTLSRTGSSNNASCVVLKMWNAARDLNTTKRSMLFVPHSFVCRLCELCRAQDGKRHSNGVGQ